MAPVKFRSRERRRRSYSQTSIGHNGMPSQSPSGPNAQGHAPVAISAVVPEITGSKKIELKPVFDLALDLVLNEIVLQARLTTNATGAVLALVRSGELICRGTTGATARDMAVCLNAKSGIAATCFASGEACRIDDLGPDPNADAVAYRQSGVRSILIVPVQGEKGPRMGILEIFSPRANAFCDRDVLTLQALARRVAANVELAQETCNHPNERSRVLATGTEKFSKAASNQKSKRSLQIQTPKFFAGFGSVDWISVLAKTAIGMVLVAGSLLARSCWQQSAGAKFAPAAHSSMSQIEKHPSSAEANPLGSSGMSFSPKPASGDPSTWPARVSARPLATASITIERQPLHKAALSQTNDEARADTAASSNDVVLFEKHKPVSKHPSAQASKSSSKDPAADILPNVAATTEDGHTDMEVLSTQAAMARLIQRIEPEYPNAARQQHIQGTVLLDVVVNTEGAVDGLSLVSGESQLMAAAAQAVRQWHFQPYIKAGKAKKFESRIAIDFSLASESASASH